MAERIVLGGIGLLCAAMAWIAFGYGLSDSIGPGSGFFPFWLGLLGVVLTLVLFVASLGKKGKNPNLLPRGEGARRAGMLLGGLALGALALQPLGFRLTTLVFCAALLFALGVRRPVLIALFALAASFGLFHVFYYWLQVPLPIGLLGI